MNFSCYFISIIILSLISCENDFLDANLVLNELSSIASNKFKSKAELLTAEPSKDQQLTDFLNGIYGTNIARQEFLKKCGKEYKPDASAHEAFLSAYAKVFNNVNMILSKKVNAKIDGNLGDYNPSNPNEFIDAKKSELPTTVLFSQFIVLSSFGKGFLAFSKCIPDAQLYELAGQEYVDQVYFMLKNDKTPIINQLFWSFRSVNNMFSFIKSEIDIKADNSFYSLGKLMRDVFVNTKQHYLYLKSNS